MSRIGKNPGRPSPKGRCDARRRRDHGQGPAGHADAHSRQRERQRSRTASELRCKADERARRDAMQRHAARAGREHGQGRDGGLREEADAGGRRLSRAGAGRQAQPVARLFASGRAPMPEGVKVETPTQTEIVVKGIDKQQVGQVAAEIRALPAAGAVQGQGRPLRGRDGHHQRNQEEVRQRDMNMMNKKDQRLRRSRATRVRIASRSATRLTVSRSNLHIYAQIISRRRRQGAGQASTLEADVRKDWRR